MVGMFSVSLRFSTTSAIVLTMLGVFATAFAPFVGSDQRNFLVIALAAISAPLIVFCRLPLGRDSILPLALVLYVVLVTVLVGGVSDVTSVGYTLIFVLSYIALSAAVSTGRVPRHQVVVLLRWVIIAFGAVSVLQIATSLAGFPVPNLILSKGRWSHNSLAVEPSHVGRALAVTLLAYLILARMGRRPIGLVGLLRREKIPMIAFAVSTLLSGSTLAVIAAPLAIVLSFSARWIVLASGALILAWPMLYVIDSPVVQRALTFLVALPSMDIHTIAAAEQSGALRVLPLLVYVEKVQIDQWSSWFGEGLGAIRLYVQGELIGAEDLIAAGFIPGFLISFGLLGCMLFFLAFIGRFLHWATLPFTLLWVMLFSNSAWNSQLFWYGLMLLRLVYHYQVTELARPSQGHGELVSTAEPWGVE